MASVGFRWLDILEKEFDKAFVDLDLTIGELESEEPDVVFNVRQKLCTLSSCFAQLTHKAQTIFQNSAKIEAELIHMRAELVESKSKREVLEQELHNLLLQLHSSQLSHLPEVMNNKKQDPHILPDVSNIKKKFEEELRLSPIHTYKAFKQVDDMKLNPYLTENAQQKIENAQLLAENASLRNSILALHSEVYGAKLAAKYLDKELAGRIQQLQLLGREMRGEVRDKLWRQLESEILLQRHKTVVRACRRNTVLNGSEKLCPKPNQNESETISESTLEHFGDIRTVVVKRSHGQGLGISITGGREHGVPILISELEPNGPAALSQQLYIGDAILSVNDRDLRQACHKEAVDILQQQTGDCILQVQYIAADDSDNSLEEDGYNFRFFDNETSDNVKCPGKNLGNCLDVQNTPTAPRTPESNISRAASRNSNDNILDVKEATSLGEKQILQVVEDLVDLNSNKGEHLENLDINLLETKDFDSNLHTTDNFIKTPPEINSNLTLNDTEANKIVETNTEFFSKILPLMNKNDINKYAVDTINTLLLYDRQNKPKIENIRRTEYLDNRNINCSLNSLNSENFSSSMQTSTDIFQDSELPSTDAASNDSNSPKSVQNDSKNDYDHNLKAFKEAFFNSNESLSMVKSDHSLLNSNDSDSSPIHKTRRDYKKVQRKHKKRYFGVKTLQSIFNSKHDGYSDVSTTGSECEDEDKTLANKVEPKTKPDEETGTIYKCSAIYTETSPQFEENVHNILADIFVKNFPTGESSVNGNGNIAKPVGTKKYFSLHGQNLRVGKALRLCPNDSAGDKRETERKKEKLLARYVYSNSTAASGEGIGDPFFGTPV